MEQFQAVRKKTKVKYNKIPPKELVFDKEDNVSAWNCQAS